jgi:hypothetical protein
MARAIQLRPKKIRRIAPKRMTDDQLASFVAKTASRFKRLCAELKPYFTELRRRFHTKTKNTKIQGCYTWDQFCLEKLDRCRRTINYFLGPPREQSSHLTASLPDSNETTKSSTRNLTLKVTTKTHNYGRIHFYSKPPEPTQKPLTISLPDSEDSAIEAPQEENYMDIAAAVEHIGKIVRGEISIATVDPARFAEFQDTLADVLSAIADELRSGKADTGLIH